MPTGQKNGIQTLREKSSKNVKQTTSTTDTISTHYKAQHLRNVKQRTNKQQTKNNNERIIIKKRNI